MYILVAGSRGYYNYEEFKVLMDYFTEAHSDIHIIHGGARGADSLAARYAKEKQLQVKVFKADWELYGKSAGFRRNVEMHDFLKTKEDRMCICFWDGESHGTQHNFKLCKENDTKLIVFNYKLHKTINV